MGIAHVRMIAHRMKQSLKGSFKSPEEFARCGTAGSKFVSLICVLSAALGR
jgi:hypothetical protein